MTKVKGTCKLSKDLAKLALIFGTLKQAKRELKKFKVPVEVYKMSIESCLKARTKIAFRKDLMVIIQEIDEVVIAKKAAKQKAAEKRKLAAKVSLPTLAKKVRSEITKGQAATLAAGKYLLQGLEAVKAQGGKQATFLTWTKESCGLGKAQSYKLISIYKRFGDNSNFNGCSMRLLYTLQACNTAIIEKAESLAIQNKLDSVSLDKLIEKETGKKPSKPAKAAKVAKPSKIENRTKREKEIQDLKNEIKVLKAMPSKPADTTDTTEKSVKVIQSVISILDEIPGNDSRIKKAILMLSAIC